MAEQLTQSPCGGLFVLTDMAADARFISVLLSPLTPKVGVLEDIGLDD